MREISERLTEALQSRAPELARNVRPALNRRISNISDDLSR